ncbi:MAG: hypothetical protein JWQ44_99 [Chthoniobacter sp.]|nr:hypothetical protein [Chthoniobacter sp.]
MKTPRINRFFGAFLALVLLHLPTAAQACTACMGDANSKSAGAINAAMFLMIGFIAVMLGSLAMFALYLKHRAACPLPPHIQLAESMHEAEGSI